MVENIEHKCSTVECRDWKICLLDMELGLLDLLNINNLNEIKILNMLRP